MATLTLNRDALRVNHREIQRRAAAHGVEVGYVTKLLCGDERMLREVLALRPPQLMDARTGNLATVRRLDGKAKTVYIKPPAPGNAEDVVRWADVSFNSELATLEALDREAHRQERRHGVVVMVEMGDLREGVVRERVADFVGRALRFDNLELVGIGTNFNCLNGTLPSEDKLWQLALFRELVEVRHGITVPWVSGGTTVALPLLEQGRVPEAVNHFRVGEALFFGADLVNGGVLDGMRDDVFALNAEVIEVAEKPVEPSGPFGEDPFGGRRQTKRGPIGTRRQALVDVGWLDLDPEYLTPADDGLQLMDVSSDMMAIDVGDAAKPVRVGDAVRFKLRYMGALKALNSVYVEKLVVNDAGETLGEPEPFQEAAPGDVAA